VSTLAVLDTTVLVAGLVESHPVHAACLNHLQSAAAHPGSYRCSVHAVAETFRVLVALPLVRRIDVDGARMVLRASVIPRFNPIPLAPKDYDTAMDIVCASGLGSGAIYDCLHLLAAERIEAKYLVTSNLKHFFRLAESANSRLRVVDPSEAIS
jgi:predicted nucleic acid-binding protein